MRFLLIRLLAWGGMAALALWLASHLLLLTAQLIWTGAAALLCALGAFLMSRQPVGVATLPGQFGASLVRWGYRVGRGQLPAASVISWLVWSIVGVGTIAALTATDAETPLMILAWEIDGLALLFMVGLFILSRQTDRPMPRSLGLPFLALLTMLLGSAALWQSGSASGRHTALLLGGGPIPILLLAYGLMIGTMLLGGRKGGFR